MKKVRILRVCIEINEKKIKDLKVSLENTRACARDAPGSNVSHSDTTKFQQSNLSLGIQKRLIEAKRELTQLRTLRTATNNVIFVGTLFGLKNTANEEITNYFLIPEGGGDSFDIEGEKITIISTIAPLCQVPIF